MIAVRLRPDLPLRELDPRLHRIAGHDVVLDLPLVSLAPFESPHPPFPPPQPPPWERGKLIPGSEEIWHCQTFLGEAPIGGRSRRIESFLSAEGYRVSVERAGAFAVSPDGSAIVFVERHTAAPELIAEVFVGPALSLALALRGTFGLHASAVAVGGEAVVFLGESGAGKSTLAALLGGDDRRLADDLLPVGRSRGRLTAFPRFPQLKLPPGEQPGLRHPEELPLRAVYWLAPPVERTQVRPLSAREAALALVRHSVAARLFGPDLLAAHLGFCARAAEEVRVASLAYPRRPGIGTAVRRVIEADLGL